MLLLALVCAVFGTAAFTGYVFGDEYVWAQRLFGHYRTLGEWLGWPLRRSSSTSSGTGGGPESSLLSWSSRSPLVR